MTQGSHGFIPSLFFEMDDDIKIEVAAKSTSLTGCIHPLRYKG